MNGTDFGKRDIFLPRPIRRKSKRWPIEREVRYKVVNGQKDISGSGKTINISSGGVLFTTEYTLSERQSING